MSLRAFVSDKGEDENKDKGEDEDDKKDGCDGELFPLSLRYVALASRR